MCSRKLNAVKFSANACSAIVAPWLIVASVVGLPSAQAQDNIPPLPKPPSASDRDDARSDASGETPALLCPEVDRPLSALTVDIRPRDPDGGSVMHNDRPEDCWTPSGRAGPPVFISGGGGCDCCWGCKDLLQLARFCHERVYFEDVCLERCGACKGCPGVHSTAKFACDLILLPAHLVINRKKPCVRTPTPHCCAPDACGNVGCNVCSP